jgi:hypothetical protein
MLILQRATLPRFASDNRLSGTAELAGGAFFFIWTPIALGVTALQRR